MSEMEIQRDRSGRIIGLQHTDDPLAGAVRGQSAITTAGAYVRAMATHYQLDPRSLERLEQRGVFEFEADQPPQLELQDTRSVGAFTIVSFQQTYQGLPVWEGGLVVRLRNRDNVVTGSAISFDPKIRIEAVKEAPKDRQAKAEKLLAELVRKAKLQDFNVHASRDLVYRYQADKRLPRPEPGAPDVPGADVAIPKLDGGEVPKDIKDNSYRRVREVLFGTHSKDIGALNWRALIDWETNSVLYLRPLVADVSGCVFPNDPISLSGNPQLGPTAAVGLLDAQRELLTLERLVLGGGNVSLTGEYVAVQDIDAPNIPPPTEPGGAAAVFCYTADSDDFAAVCAYYTHDWLYRLVETLGFDLNSYFDGASFPVPVDHRWMNIVNAQAPGNAMGNGILRFRYSLADAGSTVGIATDARVVTHEFGHGILWDHLSSPNFAFAHGLGDAMAAVLFDPESQAPDRFRTFPFNNVVLRRHDRAVASGWGWGGVNDVGGYLSTEIVSTTVFRIYRSLGGDDTRLDERQHSSRYTTYLMLQAVPLLSGVVPNTPEGFSSAMQESDQATTDFEGASGGWAHKVVRWGFEKQALYAGNPPAIDIYIDDGRSGEYPFTHELDTAPGIWNRHRPDGGSSHETPRVGVENYLYVEVGNRGSKPASRVKVQAYRATGNKGRSWPDDWETLGDAIEVEQPVSPKRPVIVGPIRWCPEGPCDERIIASATTKRDRSNISTIAGSLPTRRLVLGDNNTAQRNMEVNLPEDDRDCDADGKTRRLYRYAVKFVCGCSKGKVVAGGRYWTAINVRNTSDEAIRFSKRFSVALPNEQAGNVSDVTRNRLGPYEALEIDCEDIARHNKAVECCFLKGFAVLESPVELDVIAVYTAAKSDGEVETLDVETVRPTIIKQKRREPRPPDDDDTPPPDKKKLPDLIPVAPFPPGPPFFPSGYCASPNELRVIVLNQGNGDAGPTTTRVEFLQEGVIQEQPTPALTAGSETTLSFKIPSGCVVETCQFRITVNARPADNVTESNSANNVDTSSCGIAS